MLATDIRPYSLDEVIGQKNIIVGLKNYFKTKSLPNCIAFVGHSGCGKNTLANITAMALNCQNPKEDGQPCGECPSCKDVKKELFQRDIYCYSGADVVADEIKKIEEIISYNPQFDSNTIIIINEAQIVPNLRRLLEIIESNRKNVYFIFTSTDTNKFSNTFGKDNKTQEKNALRSRMAMFNLKPITTNDIMEYLFRLLEKIDPEQKIPDVFIDEGIITISENSKNNLRQAINDFSTAINSECYNAESIINLLGYEDEKKEYEQIINLATKSKKFIDFIRDFSNLEGFFNYSFKIITDNIIRDLSDTPFELEWKEKSYKVLKSTGNLKELSELYSTTHNLMNGYFKDSVFLSQIFKFYLKSENYKPIDKKNTLLENNVEKKVKKIKIRKEEE